MFSFYNQETAIGKFLKSRGISIIIILAFVIATVSSFGVSTATAVEVTQNGGTKTVFVHNDNVNDILLTAGVKDDQDYELTKVDDGYLLKIGKKIRVSVQAPGSVYSFSMISDTVASALFNHGIVYGENDVITPALNSYLTEDSVVTVKSNSTLTQTTFEDIPFNTVYEEDASMTAGEEKVAVAGVNGKQESVYSVSYTNGVETGRTLVSNTVVTPAVDQKIIKGTAAPQTTSGRAPVVTANSGITTSADSNSRTYSDLALSSPVQLDENGCPVNYTKCITGIASGYSPEDGTWTASGNHVRVGYIAVDPDVIPYGTYMYIKTPDNGFIYGVAMAADTGGFVNMGRVADLFFASAEEACNWGVRTVEIYVF